MGKDSNIEWTDHTFSPWIGCQAVSPACDHCYAKTLVEGRMKEDFAARRRTSPNNWNLPLRWNRQAEREGRRFRVFCASLADVFDNQVPEEWRDDLWRLIAATPHLDWLLLTKRPQNIRKFIDGPALPNVWLGTTVENQEEADRRIPHLLSVPAKVHFLSCEPLLGPVDLTRVWAAMPSGGRSLWNSMWRDDTGARVDWVIAGGESGKDARPMHPAWARSLRDQCAAAGVPFLFKQWGEYVPDDRHPIAGDPIAPGSSRYEKIRFADGTEMRRVGKKAAGRLLDGVQHDGVPT